MYTENLVLFTQKIMYGESTTSFSNFKGLLKHRKNAGLFIHCGVVAKSTQTIAQKTEGSTLGDYQARF